MSAGVAAELMPAAPSLLREAPSADGGREKMGNGSGVVTNGLAAVALCGAGGPA